MVLQHLHVGLVGELKVCCASICIVYIFLELETAEDLQALLEELPIKNEARQPELAVLLEYTLVDGGRDLNLACCSDRQAALGEEVLRGSLISILALILQNNAVVVGELIKPVLVDEAVALVDQNVSVLRLLATLAHHDSLHLLVTSILTHLSIPVLILATEALFRDLPCIEVLHMRVIELVPLVIALFLLLSILDEGIIVTSLRCTIVDHNALQRVFEVLICHCAVKQDSLVRVEILHGEVFVVHLFNEVLARDVLLRVGFHIKLSWEGTVVIHLVFLHCIKVEFKALQLEKQHIGQPLDRASFQCVALQLALLTVKCVVALEHLTFHKAFQAFKNGLFVLYLDRDSHEGLFALCVMWAALADELISEAAIEEVLHDLLLLGTLNQVLNPVDQHVEELVNVSLHHWIDW